MESNLKISPKYRLGKITNKYLILEILSYLFFRQKGLSYLFQTSLTFRQLLRENYNASLLLFEDALSHFGDLPRTHTHIDLPIICSRRLSFLLMSGGRLYAELDSNLYVYTMSELIGTYRVDDRCQTGIVIDDRIYICCECNLLIYEVTSQLSDPLKIVTTIPIRGKVNKLLSLKNKLMLAVIGGYLQVFDIIKCEIIKT